ncbi:MAG TPA: glycine reductase [Firmicutes bacterium]|nr:glycine reductase [Bacillota bacterium]
MGYPVVKGYSYVLVHAPDLVRYGSKPTREIRKDAHVEEAIRARLRTYEAARDYPPNQVFLGNQGPEVLAEAETPWFDHPLAGSPRHGRCGEIMPEEEFYGVMRFADEFDLIHLEAGFLERSRQALAGHALFSAEDLARLGPGMSREQIEERVKNLGSLPLFTGSAGGGTPELVGCLDPGHEEDTSLTPDILLENLACKASGVLALRHLLHGNRYGVGPLDVDYVFNSGEEAVGDRYQRGAGNLAKAMAELSWCQNCTGSDVKAFCCSPVHSIVIAAGLVQAGVFRQVVVVGGGSLAKLGMKFRGHLNHPMPVLEDVLGAMAFLIGPDDGVSPQVRLDCVGKHDVVSGSSPQNIMEALVVKPLQRVGLRLGDVEKYAVEMHNPEVTEPAGSGNVPRTNYRMIASLAVLGGEIPASRLDAFAEEHGMRGFSPTQGHIAAGVPFLGHAWERMRAGAMDRAMFVAKGSLFLGRMTKLSDGMSFLLQRNPALGN